MTDIFNGGTKTSFYNSHKTKCSDFFKKKKNTRQDQLVVQSPLNPKEFTYDHMVMIRMWGPHLCPGNCPFKDYRE